MSVVKEIPVLLVVSIGLLRQQLRKYSMKTLYGVYILTEHSVLSFASHITSELVDIALFPTHQVSSL
jgi:hypothetical protein